MLSTRAYHTHVIDTANNGEGNEANMSAEFDTPRLIGKQSVKKPYKCPVCSKMFRNTSHRKEHMITHTLHKLFRCSECTKGYTRRSDLLSHFTRLHGDLFICECKERFSSELELGIHKRKRDGENPYKCCKCNMHFLTKHALNGHFSHHVDSPYGCHQCEEAFGSIDQLQAHLKIHTKEGTHKPLVCPEKFPTEHDCSGNFKLHTNRNLINIIPEVCSKPSQISSGQEACSEPSEMSRIHEAYFQPSQISNYPEACSVPRQISRILEACSEPSQISRTPEACSEPSQISRIPEAFSVPSQISRTPEACSVPSQLSRIPEACFVPSQISRIPEACSVPSQISSIPEGCSVPSQISRFPDGCFVPSQISRFPEASSESNQISNNPEGCSEPSQISNNQVYCNSLADHSKLTSNTTKRNVSIEVTRGLVGKESNIMKSPSNSGVGNEANMSSASSVPRLISIKSIKKPYPCPVCNMSFRSTSHRKQHMYVHSGKRPYSCSDCTQGFKTRKGLLSHFNQHHGDLFICECKERFSSEVELNIHKRKHDGENPFKCCKCNMHYLTEAALYGHFSSHIDSPYGCHQCEQAFGSIDKLQAHLKIHTSGESHHVCQERFPTEHNDGSTADTSQEGCSDLCHKLSNPASCGNNVDNSKLSTITSETNIYREENETKEGKTQITLHTPSDLDNVQRCTENIVLSTPNVNKANLQDTESNGGEGNEAHMSSSTSIPRLIGNQSVKKRYPCLVCNKKFESASYRKQHMYTHTKKMKYECSECTQCFVKQRDLLSHFNQQHGSLFICECKERFSSEVELNIHKRKHDGENPFKCCKCDMHFLTEAALTGHFISHIEKQYNCFQCEQTFCSIGQVHAHMRTHKLEGTHRCFFCKEYFRSEAKCVRHMELHIPECPVNNVKDSCDDALTESIEKLSNFENVGPSTINSELANGISKATHEGKEDCIESNTATTESELSCVQKEIFERKKYACPECKTEYPRQRNLMEHLYRHIPENGFKCVVCQKVFGTKTDLNRHAMCHRGDKPFPCPKCGGRFTVKDNLTKHMRMHMPQLLCELCGKGLRSERSLLLHMKSHERTPCYKCPDCNLDVFSKAALVRHLIGCRGGMPHQCAHCKERFRDKYEYNRHVKRHTAKSFQCHICDKLFRWKGHLENHLRQHSEGRKYKCPECKKGFFLNSALTEHLKRHSGRRPYKCYNCDKTFITNSGRMRHLRRVHKDYRVYGCEVCGKRFSAELDYKSHKKKVVGEMPYQCLGCEQKFSSKCDLMMHSRTHST